MFSQLKRHFRLFLGSALNLLFVSLPLVFIDSFALYSLLSPSVILFFLLLSTFSFLEAKASLGLSFGAEKQTHYSPHLQAHTQPHRPSKRLTYTQSRHGYLPFFAAILLLIIFQVSLIDNLTQDVVFSAHPRMILFGGLLMVMGIVFRLKSIAALKQYFVSHIQLVSNHQLVTKGVFSIVRHPSELGLLLIVFGTVVLLESFLAFVITLSLFVPLTIYRVALEDHLLHSRFSDTFAKFKETTPSLLPKI